MALFGRRKREAMPRLPHQHQQHSEGRLPSGVTECGEATVHSTAKGQHVTIKEKGIDGESSRTPSADSNELSNTLAQEQAETGPSNPFAGGVEGGVTYMSLSWW